MALRAKTKPTQDRPGLFGQRARQLRAVSRCFARQPFQQPRIGGGTIPKQNHIGDHAHTSDGDHRWTSMQSQCHPSVVGIEALDVIRICINETNDMQIATPLRVGSPE